MNCPNALMVRFMTVVEAGGSAGLDPQERAIAVAVGIEFGWMSDADTLTDEGRKWTVAGTAAPEFTPRPLPPLMTAALIKIGDERMGLEEFERAHGIPARSARLVLDLAREMQP